MRRLNGCELLEYLSPRDGRPMPADVRANNLVHWQVRLSLPDLETATKHLRDGKAWFVSPGLVAVPDGRLGFSSGLLVRDADGHAVLLAGQ